MGSANVRAATTALPRLWNSVSTLGVTTPFLADYTMPRCASFAVSPRVLDLLLATTAGTASDMVGGPLPTGTSTRSPATARFAAGSRVRSHHSFGPSLVGALPLLGLTDCRWRCHLCCRLHYLRVAYRLAHAYTQQSFRCGATLPLLQRAFPHPLPSPPPYHLLGRQACFPSLLVAAFIRFHHHPPTHYAPWRTTPASRGRHTPHLGVPSGLASLQHT